MNSLRKLCHESKAANIKLRKILSTWMASMWERTTLDAFIHELRYNHNNNETGVLHVVVFVSMCLYFLCACISIIILSLLLLIKVKYT